MFTAAWFAVVMGFGGLIDAVAKIWLVGGGAWIQDAVWVNTGIFAVLISLWIVRWFLAPQTMWREMTHPASGHYFALVPIAIALMGLNWSLMGAVFVPSVLDLIMNVLWIVSVGLGVLFSLIITEAMMRQSVNNPGHVSFAWLLGPVATALFPLLGTVVVQADLHRSVGWVRLVDVTDIALFGIGLFMFIFVSAFLFARYFSAPQPPAEVTPTSWLLLGAASVLSLGLLGIMDSSVQLHLVHPSPFAFVLALALWGLAGWSFFLGLLMSLRVWFAKQMRFTLAWWAFVFPLSAYAIDSRSLASAGHIQWLSGFSGGLMVVVLLLFLIVVLETIVSLITGRLLKPQTVAGPEPTASNGAQTP